MESLRKESVRKESSRMESDRKGTALGNKDRVTVRQR